MDEPKRGDAPIQVDPKIEERTWTVNYLALDAEGLIQGYVLKVRGLTIGTAFTASRMYLRAFPHYITNIGLAADETIINHSPQPDPLADPLDWPWPQEG